MIEQFELIEFSIKESMGTSIEKLYRKDVDRLSTNNLLLFFSTQCVQNSCVEK